jgi:hypothetical protein
MHFETISSAIKVMCVPSDDVGSRVPMTHTLIDSRHAASPEYGRGLSDECPKSLLYDIPVGAIE